MSEWIEQDHMDENHLYVHLKNPELLDLSIFDRLSNDDFCLPCMLTNEKTASMVYAIEGYIPLHDFLSQYVFEKEEFTFLTFVDSYKYLKLDYLWIAYPFYGYDASCNWHLINFRESIEQPIYALTELLEEHPSIQDYSKCWYDFEKCIFVFEKENERITMDFQALSVKKDDIANIQYKNIGTKYGMCQYLKQNTEPDYIPRNKCSV